jgi:hypothetical protein
MRNLAVLLIHFIAVLARLRGTCPYQKCYPALMPIKSATFKKMQIDQNVTLMEKRWMELLAAQGHSADP